MERIKLLGIFCIVVGIFLGQAAAVQAGRSYGDLSFPQAGSPEDQKYLGVGSGAFRLSQIDAPYLVLEIMRVSCPHCQKEVGAMNKFYSLVQGSDIKDKIRFLAAAQGCSAGEAAKFRKAYGVTFPVLADPQGTLEKALHINGVPTVVVLKRDGQVLRVDKGGIDSPKKALAEMRALMK